MYPLFIGVSCTVFARVPVKYRRLVITGALEEGVVLHETA